MLLCMLCSDQGSSAEGPCKGKKHFQSKFLHSRGCIALDFLAEETAWGYVTASAAA